MIPTTPQIKDVCADGVSCLFQLLRPEDVDYIMGRIDGVCSCFRLTFEERAYVDEVYKHLSTMKAERVYGLPL